LYFSFQAYFLFPLLFSRVLGLGDLGANGMPIPIGKLNLYIAGAGIHPQRVLPVVLDLGTNSQKLIDNPLYLGLQQPRPADPEFFELVDEMMAAFRNRWPNVLIQFEDFSNPHAWQLLSKYRHKHLMFNDDIQSTGTIALAGLLASLRCRNKPLKSIVNERIVCVGAGSAGLGVCETIVRCMVDEGLDYDRARANFWVMDEHGLIGHTRQNM
jgi:malic enzyme